MAEQLCKKVNAKMSRQEKEQIIYEELMKTDRVFAKNCREMDLAFDYGRETALHFIHLIETAEMRVGRRLNACEIENEYQKVREGLKNGLD